MTRRIYEDEFWRDTKIYVKDLLKRLMESTMEEELMMYTQAEWHERTQAKIDYRNGYRHRDLLTEYGDI